MIVLPWLEMTVLGLLLLTVATLFGLRKGVVQPRREWRLVQATRVLGLVGGVAAAYAMAGRWEYGRGEMLAPSIFGLVVLAAVAVGETVVRPARPTGARSASLRTRAIRDYLPARASRAVLATGLGLLTTLALTTVTAARDQASQEMRVLACEAGGLSQVRGPYPGSFYSAPLASVLVLVLLVATLSAHQAVRRPRGFATTEEGDEALRRRSVSVIVAATGVAFAVTHFGIAMTAAAALVGLDSCAPTWAAPLGWILGLSAFPALLFGIWSLVRIVRSERPEQSWN